MNKDVIKLKLKKICPKAKKYEFYKNAIIYKDSSGKKHVIKENNNNLSDLYNYLNSRGFGYIPKLEYIDKDIYIYQYISNTNTPDEQKMSDLIKIVALLHNKTVYYKETSIDEVKEAYENLLNEIDELYNYYDDIVTMIDSKVFMSPSEYMLARNCTMIFNCLNFCKMQLNDWYSLMENKTKKRVVLLHNNLGPNHLIRSDENYIISWNKTKRDIPIYDFINLYKKYYDQYDFSSLYKEYIKTFPLNKEETKLLFIILFLPPKIIFSKSEINTTMEVSKLCSYLTITDKLFMENEAKYTEKQNNKIYE